MSIINRMQHCKSLSMITVCKSSNLMFHLMTFKITLFTKLDDTVFCHSCVPHKITACCIVFWIFYCHTKILDYISHQCFGNIIRYIAYVRFTEICLHDMRQDIKTSGNHLSDRNCISILRIH